MFFRILMLFAGIGILYGTGWNMAFGSDIASMLSKITEGGVIENIFNNMSAAIYADSILVPDYLFDGDFAVINFNNSFYGFYNTNRFFNSTLVEWFGLGAGIMALWIGITTDTQDGELVTE
jgi:hypothetical protein